MTEQKAGTQPEFWEIFEFWAAIVLGALTAIGSQWLSPIGGVLGGFLPLLAGSAVWTLGYWKGVRPAFLLMAAFLIGMFIWSAMARPFIGDTLFYDDLIFDDLAISATGTGLKWRATPYAYPTPTHRVRDWADPKVCTEHDRFVCGVVFDTYFESDQGWRIILKHDGTLTWPEGVTDEEAARFFCDLPADEWKDYNRKIPYFIALRAARPSLSPALEAECGL